MTTKEAVALLERYSNYDGMGIPNLAGCKEAMRVAVDALKEACPELAESEDERIRKEIINYILYKADGVSEEQEHSWIAYLEKQKEQKPSHKFNVGDTIHCKYDDREFAIKSVDLANGVYEYTKEGCGNDIDYADENFELVEQKPAEWSEEDEEMRRRAICACNFTIKYLLRSTHYEEARDWLKSLPVGFITNPQYNSDMVDLLVSELQVIAKNNGTPKQYDAEISWLKSLRPQPHWKPSKEQMEALDKAIPVCMGVVGRDEVVPLESLCEQLKKL